MRFDFGLCSLLMALALVGCGGGGGDPTTSASGAPLLPGDGTAASAVPTAVVFKQASSPLMVTSSAQSGSKQSTLVFQVQDASGSGIAGQLLDVSLENSAVGAGVTFLVGGVQVNAAQQISSDKDGNASITVVSGSLPTSVVVKVALAALPGIKNASSGVAVTAGRPTQNAASLSASSFAIEGYNIDGATSTITMRVADRQGNPIPQGATVNFTTNYGSVTGTCQLDASSACSVTYTSQGTRPPDGIARILAFMDGEESFVDSNGNNVWDAGESFSSLGLLYRDDNGDGLFSAGEPQYPLGSTGTNVCSDVNSVANTCLSTWNSNVRVRKQITLAVSTSSAAIGTRTNTGAPVSSFTFQVADINGRSMPAGTTVAVAPVGTTNCKVNSLTPASVPTNVTNPTSHFVVTNADAACDTAQFTVTVTAPSGLVTLRQF